MSKNEVLEQIYPDEVPDILKKANIERARQREQELTGYFYTLMAPVIPWMKDEDGFQKDLIENITNELKQIHNYLKNGKLNSKDDKGVGVDELGQQPNEDPFKQLENLQSIIAGTRTRMNRGKAR